MHEFRPVHYGKRGATLSLFLEVAQDSASEIDGTESVRAVAKKVSTPQDNPPGDDAPEVFSFSVAWVPASGGQSAGWHLEASAAVTQSIDASYYITDVRVDMGSGRIIQTAPLIVDLRERITEPA